MADVEYKVQVPVELLLENREVRKLGETVRRQARAASSGAGGGAAAAAGGGAAGMGGMAGFAMAVKGILGKLAIVASVVVIISKIISNQYSALKDLLEMFSTLISLYLKPISDALFILFLPIFRVLISWLPRYYAVMDSIGKAIKPVADLLRWIWDVLAKMAKGIGGISGPDWSGMMASGMEWLSSMRTGFDAAIVSFSASLLATTAAWGKRGESVWTTIKGIGEGNLSSLYWYAQDVFAATGVNASASFALSAESVGAGWLTMLEGVASQYSSMISSVAQGFENVIWALVDAIPGTGGGGGWFPDFGDFIWRPGEKPIAFSPQDTIVGAQGGGAPGGGGMTVNFYGLNTEQAVEELSRLFERQRREYR